MSSWLRSSNSRKSLHRWVNDVASETKNDKDVHSPSKSPTTSTAVDESLPAPATHADRYSIASSHRKRTRRAARFSRIRLWWDDLLSKLDSGSAPSSTSILDESTVDDSPKRQTILGPIDDGDVDEVVVDRDWSDEFHSTLSNSDEGPTKSKTGSHRGGMESESHRTVEDSLLTRSRFWHIMMEIFSCRFQDERKERHYQQVCLDLLSPVVL